MARATTFVRTASGLRRDFSVLDLFLMNFMNGHFIFETLLFAGMAQVFASFAGADLYLGITIQGLAAVPVTVAYAMLSTAMPRTGGDYVWESRILHPVVGFVATFTAGIVGALLWMPWNGYNSAVIGMSSGLGMLGRSLSDLSLSSSAAWFMSTEGQYVMMAISIIMPTIFIAIGLKRYAWIQKGIFALALIGFVIVIGLLLSSNHTTFVESFDKLAGAGAYQAILDEAKNTGVPSTEFSLYSTIVWAAYMAVGTSWQACTGTPIIGEVKSTSSFKKMLLAYSTGPFISIAFGYILFTALFSTVGKDFIIASGYLLGSGNQMVTSLPFQPYFIWLPTVLAQGSALVPVVALITAGVVASAWFFNVGNTIWPTRYFFAQSFDRVLPTAMSYVHPRWGTPMVALGVAAVASMAWWVYASSYPQIWIFFTAATILIFLQNGLVSLSALVFPFRQSMAYNASPLAKYKVGGTPLISIVGVLGILYSVGFTYAFLAIPALGVSGYPPSFAVIGGVIVVAAIYYYIVKWYRQKQQGINISLAFKEVPPV